MAGVRPRGRRPQCRSPAVITGFPSSRAALPGSPQPLNSVLLTLRPTRALAQGSFVEAAIYEALLHVGIVRSGLASGDKGCPGGPASPGWAAQCPAVRQHPGSPGNHAWV